MSEAEHFVSLQNKNTYNGYIGWTLTLHFGSRIYTQDED